MKKPFIILTIISTLTWIGIIIYKQSLPYHDVGKVYVKNLSKTYFEIRQENEFDSSTALDYKVMSNGKEIQDWKFLMGTHDYLDNPEVFNANSIDSVLYLTWGDTISVCAIYDLKTKNKYPNWDYSNNNKIKKSQDLFKTLKNKKPYLKKAF